MVVYRRVSRIPGEPPAPYSLQPRTSMVVCYYHDGRIIIRQAAKKRRGKLPAITIQQRRTWDAINRAINRLAPDEIAVINRYYPKTDWRPRDIMVAAGYGNFLAFFGWGRWQPGKKPNKLPHPLHQPQPVNCLVHSNMRREGARIKWDITTAYPSTPLLATFTTDYLRVWRTKKKHGILVRGCPTPWFDEVPTLYNPTSGADNVWHWNIPAAGVKNLAVLQIEAPTHFAWHSQVRTAPPPPPITTYRYFNPSSTSGPHPYTPSPATIASLNANLDFWIAFWLSQGADILGVVRGEVCIRSPGLDFPPPSATPLPSPTCDVAPSRNDTWSWYLYLGLR